MRDNLQRLMNERGVTQAELSRKAKVPLGSVNAFLQGKSKPSMDTIIKLAAYFNVTIDELVLGEVKK